MNRFVFVQLETESGKHEFNFHRMKTVCVKSNGKVLTGEKMENLFDDDVSVQEMELLEPNYEVFMKWAQPTTIWDTLTMTNRIRMATIR